MDVDLAEQLENFTTIKRKFTFKVFINSFAKEQEVYFYKKQ